MSSASENKNNSLITEYEWMIRPCEMYREEYGECTSIKGRFHQYFIYGETMDCTQWKRDLDNCLKWKNKDTTAGNNVIKSEQIRRVERLRAHYENNIWEKRSEPPADWNKPLPEYISKDYEYSYLATKAKEMRGELPAENSMLDRNLCVLM